MLLLLAVDNLIMAHWTMLIAAMVRYAGLRLQAFQNWRTCWRHYFDRPKSTHLPRLDPRLTHALGILPRANPPVV